MMKTHGMLTAVTLSLFGFVWGARHVDEPRGLFVALFSCLTLFSAGREWLKRL